MAEPTDRRRLIILLAVGGGLILAFLAFKLLSGGGGSDTSAPIGPTTPPAGVLPTTTTAPPPEVPGGSFDVFATKDPFQPVVSVDTGGSSGGTTDTTTPGGGGTTATTVPPSQNPSTGTSVALIDVYDDNGTTKAQVRVGSTVYTVGVGDTFATSYSVVSLSGTCGQFLYGDSPFQLCEGEEVIK